VRGPRPRRVRVPRCRRRLGHPNRPMTFLTEVARLSSQLNSNGKGDVAGAEAAYRRADQRGDALGAFRLGLLREQRGDLAGAETAFARAAERGHPGAASDYGVLLAERGDVVGAEAAFRRADARGDGKGRSISPYCLRGRAIWPGPRLPIAEQRRVGTRSLLSVWESSMRGEETSPPRRWLTAGLMSAVTPLLPSVLVYCSNSGSKWELRMPPIVAPIRPAMRLGLSVLVYYSSSVATFLMPRRPFVELISAATPPPLLTSD
jgi:hypothetical protein